MFETFTLDFKLENYINLKPHKIEFNDCIHIIIFADHISENLESTKDNKEDIFEENNLKQDAILDQEITTDKKIITHKMKNMLLFKHTSLLDFKKIVNSICNCEVFNLNLAFSDKYNFSNKLPNVNFYDNYLSVGNNSIYFKTTTNFKNDYGNQIVFYLPTYQKNLKYVTELIKRTSKVSTLKLNYQFNKLSLIYYTTKKDININLCELFNLHDCKKIFKRIIIHDTLLDHYYNKPLIQYIKQPNTFELGTKHVEAKMNTLTLIYSKHVTDNIVIDSIDIFKDGNLKLNLNINNDASVENILKILEDYFKTETDGISEFSYLYNHLYINEVNSGLDSLTENDYIIKVTDVNSIYTIPNSSLSDVKSLNKIFIFPEIKSRFKSNTSVNFNHYNFLNENILYSFLREIYNNGSINESSYKNKICPELHYTLDSTKNLVLSCTRFSSFEEMVFALYFTLPLVQYPHMITEDFNDEDKIAKKIILRSQKISTKTNLKQLLAKDPILFAPRTVDKKPRSYSALCQKQEQRPVLLSQQEYNIIKEILPESVMDLQNQTYENQHNYLFCPFENFKYFNYHHFNGQKCIVRCTTKLSNQTQYNQCANELGAYSKTEFNNKYENNSIIFYNEYLNENRKCYPPNEFRNLLLDYVLISPKLNNEHISQYCHRIYNMDPFIIKRDSNNKRYYILSTFDENNSEDSMLCIQTENNEQKFMIFINIKNNRPLILKENPEFKNFFKHFIRNNIIYDNYINFVCEHILMDYSLNNKQLISLKEKIKKISELKITDFIKEIKTNWNCQIVYQKNKLYGIIKKKDNIKYYYPTPIIDQINIDSTFIKADTLLKDIYSKNIILPSLETINPNEKIVDTQSKFEYIVKPSMDEIKYISGLLFETQLEPVLICCQETELNEKYITDYIIIDTDIYYQMMFLKKKIQIKINTIFTKDENMIYYLENQIEKYIKINPEYENMTKEENTQRFIQYIDSKNVYSEENQFVYIGTNTISLMKSKINKKDMIDVINSDAISFDKIEIGDFIYNKIIKSLKLHHELTEQIIEKQFI